MAAIFPQEKRHQELKQVPSLPLLSRVPSGEPMYDRNSPEYWELRAEEARSVAEQMHHPECRKGMFEVAVGYGLMAETARRLRKYEPMDEERIRITARCV